MSKKKINNRLDKLFEDIEKVPEAKQAAITGKSVKKTYKTNKPIFPDSISDKTNAQARGNDVNSMPKNEIIAESLSGTSSTMLSTAFRTDEKSWATLKVVDEANQRTWGTEEQMLLKQVADQLSLALENARLFQEAQRRASEMTALADVAREISATLEIQQVMERIAKQAQLILNAVTSAVYVPDPQFQTLIAISAIGEEADPIKADALIIGNGILGNIALTKTAEIINNASNNPNAVTIKGTENSSYVHEHLMAAPILSKGQLSGLLAVWRVGEENDFSGTELEFLVSLAQQAAIAVENARLFEETQERAEELTVLNEMARELSAEMNINRIAETAYRYINRLIDATNFYIALFEESTGFVSFPVFVENNVKIDIPTRKLEKGLTEYIIRTREPLFLANNVTERIRSLGLEGIVIGSNKSVLSWLGVPLLVGSKPIGAMAVQSFESQNRYKDHDKNLMMAIAGQVAIALQNARLFNDTQARARREKILREITARVRATNDPEMIAKAAIRELGQALGVPTFIHLGNKQVISSQDVEKENTRDYNKTMPEGGI